MTMRNKLRIAVIGIFIATMLSSLFGCGEKYTVGDIVGVSLWESAMDRNASYSYALTMEDDSWYLSAECGNLGRHERFDCLYMPVAVEDADAILDVVADGGYIKKTRSPKIGSLIFAPDAPRRGVMLTFSDNSQQSAEISAPQLAESFRKIAAAIEEELPLYSIEDTTGLAVYANCMNGSDTFSFELYRLEGEWYLSAEYDGISFGEISIDKAEADTLLGIAFEEALDVKIFTYRELTGGIDGLEVTDEDIYQVSMQFGKESKTARIRSERLEEGFYALAEKYAEFNTAGEG